MLDPPLEKIVRRTQVPEGGALARLDHSMAHVKILGNSILKYGISKKSIWVGTISPHNLRD